MTVDMVFFLPPLLMRIKWCLFIFVEAEYAYIPVEALAAIPDGLSFTEAAPLMCAGITMFNSLRHR